MSPTEPGIGATVDPLIGLRIGNYVVSARIGTGGNGAVYLAEHPGIGKKVAVKVLLPQHSQRPDLVARFFNEARAAASLSHPAFVDVFDFGTLPDGAAYLVMDFLDGESLGARIERVAPFEAEIVIELGRQLAAGMAAAHDKNIIHRDLKPENIFLTSDPELPFGERIRILDFGTAKLTEPGRSDVRTSTFAVMGTPSYMSPEQCRGAGQVDQRADIYSVGCVLYQMATGRPPIDLIGVGEIMAAHLYAPVPEPTSINPAVPPALAAVIMRTLAKDPAARFATMKELGAALAAVELPQHQPTSAPAALPQSATGPGPGPVEPARAVRISEPPRGPRPSPERPGDVLRDTGAVTAVDREAGQRRAQAAAPGAGRARGSGSPLGWEPWGWPPRSSASSSCARRMNLSSPPPSQGPTAGADPSLGKPLVPENPTPLAPPAAKPPTAAPAPVAAGLRSYQQALELVARGSEEHALPSFRRALRGTLPVAKRAHAESQIIALARQFGEIEITSDVAQATVLLDDHEVGRTPLAEPLVVRPGSHKITLVGVGFVPRDHVLEVSAGQKQVVRFRF